MSAAAAGDGHGSVESAKDRQRRRMEERNLGQPYNEEGQLTAEYLETLTETQLDPGDIDMLANLMSKDFVLGFYTEAETVEFKWLARIHAMRVFARFPANDCVITGEYRKELYDGDENENLTPLTDRDKEVIRTFIKGVFARATRSKRGWQQDKVGEQVQVSRVEDEKEDSGGWLNLFG